jgi:hypothetical protein
VTVHNSKKAPKATSGAFFYQLNVLLVVASGIASRYTGFYAGFGPKGWHAVQASELFDVSGEVVLVTGGGGGIGLAMGRVLALNGAKVALADINFENVQAAAASLRSDGAMAVTVELDVRDDQMIVAAFDQVEAELGRGQSVDQQCRRRTSRQGDFSSGSNVAQCHGGQCRRRFRRCARGRAAHDP